MKLCVSKKLTIAAVLLVISYIAFGGCGKKGPPVAPHREKPQAVKDLRHRLSGSNLELTWSIPEKGSRQHADVTGFKVYAAKIALSESDCETCPLKFKAVADIPIQKTAEQNQLTFSDTLESGYRYVFMVRGYIVNGLISEDSNYVEFPVE